jgi:hypothetical protein
MLFGVEYSLKTKSEYNYFLLGATARTWEGEETVTSQRTAERARCEVIQRTVRTD